MPRYEPLDAGVPLKASRSDLVAFQWQINGIRADFIMPDDEGHLLRVSFDRPCIVRLLDELPLSTEEDETPNEGLMQGTSDGLRQKPLGSQPSISGRLD